VTKIGSSQHSQYGFSQNLIRSFLQHVNGLSLLEATRIPRMPSVQLSLPLVSSKVNLQKRINEWIIVEWKICIYTFARKCFCCRSFLNRATTETTTGEKGHPEPLEIYWHCFKITHKIRNRLTVVRLTFSALMTTTTSPQSPFGRYVGLCFPLSNGAIWVANLPTVCDDASTKCHARCTALPGKLILMSKSKWIYARMTAARRCTCWSMW
jgi:hypothetical protein